MHSQHTYRYLQQATIPPVKEWTKGKGILGNLKMEYMGSAEFEFGAVPKALGRFLNAVEPLVFGKITVTLPNHPLRPNKGTSEVLVRYLVRESQQVMLEEMLRNWPEAAKRFKEWNVHLNRPNDLVFCIDKGYEAFMWQGKLGKRLIVSQVQASADLLVEHGWIDALSFDAQQRINELCGVHQDQE